MAMNARRAQAMANKASEMLMKCTSDVMLQVLGHSMHLADAAGSVSCADNLGVISVV